MKNFIYFEILFELADLTNDDFHFHGSFQIQNHFIFGF